MSEAYIAVLAAIAAPIGALVGFLVMRRAKLREIGTTTDAVYITSAKQWIETLQSQLDRLNAENEQQKRDRDVERTNFLNQLNVAHEENQRVNMRLAQMQTDLDIAQRQIETLRNYLPGSTQMSLGGSPPIATPGKTADGEPA